MPIGPEMVWAWSREISSDLAGRRCTGIETGSTWAALSFAPDSGILCSLHHGFYGCCRVWKADFEELRETAGKMPRFDEMLKKYLPGAKLAAADQIGFDRILKLDFVRAIGAGFVQRFSLIFEFMSHRSNLFITDEDGRILEVLRPVHPEDRQPRIAIAGVMYAPPPPVSERTIPELLVDLAFDKPVAGFGKELSRALNEAAEKWPADVLRKGMAGFLEDSTAGMRFQWLKKTVTLFPGLLPGAVPVQADHALDAAREAVLFPLLDEETKRLKKQVLDALRKDLKNIRAKRKGLQTRKMQAAEAWKWKQAGELLLAWQHSVPKGASEVELTDWEKDPPEPVKIRLDPVLSPVKNAEAYFRLFKKKKISTASAEREMNNLKKRERSLQGMIVEAANIDNIRTLRRFGEEKGLLQPPGKKRRKKPLPHRRFELDGALVLVGRNERGNRHVTFDLAKGNDIWLHARDVPGSHVVLRRLDGRESSFSPDDRRLLFAASLAAYYSKNREAGKVLVDYTEKKHVVPQKGAVADVTYHHGRSVTVSPLYWKDCAEGTP